MFKQKPHKKTFMKRILLPIFTIVVLLASCEKTVTFDDTRKNDNETQFAKITANPDYKKIESKTGAGHIMYKVIKEGEIDEETSQKPLFNDRVKLLYTGWYKHFWTKEDTFIDDNGNKFQNKFIFDTTAGDSNDVPRTFGVNEVVDGFSTALQNMNVGDKWEVWIPWKLGYGEFDNSAGGISAYTTLVFEIELMEIRKQ